MPGWEAKYHSLRGGAWNVNPINLRATFHFFSNPPYIRSHYIGFRVVEDVADVWRSARGGSWNSLPEHISLYSRFKFHSSSCIGKRGFRVVEVL